MKYTLLSIIVLNTITVFAQVQINKPINMSGGTNAERIVGNVGDPSVGTDAVNANNVQKGSLTYAPGALTASVYQVNLSPAATAYADGMVVNFKPDLINTSPVSIKVNALASITIKKNISTDLAVGDIAANQLVSVIYYNGTFQLLAGGANNNILNQTATDQSAGFRVNGNGIFNGGSVAIGKPSPTSNLDIKGTVNVAGTSVPATFSATGGSVSTSGAYTVHTFLSSGTFTPNTAGTVEVLVVAGGGGGSGDLAGGGGGGGVVYNTSVAVTPQAYTVTVGAGGYGGGTTRQSNTWATNGQNSSFANVTAVGGGRGGAYWTNDGVHDIGGMGGSGGGGAGTTAGNCPGGAGISGQGNNGGNGGPSPNFPGGGGGGAATAGGNYSGVNAGNGGDGISNSISGSAVIYGGGGGGGGHTGAPGNGGQGGGGKGGGLGSLVAVAGAPNTGGGGGGGGYNSSIALAGANGGSGIIIIRYLTGTASTNGIAVDASGKMGIGTTSPTAQLHATGSVRLSSYTSGYLMVDANGNLGVSSGAGGTGAGSLYTGSGTPTAFSATSTAPSVVTANGYVTHTFNTVGTFSFTANGAANIEVLVVGGGGGGSGDLAGGGGAGGVVYNAAFPVNAQTYTVTVGNGGNGGGTVRQSTTLATNGQNSSFASLTAFGGGRGGAYWASNGVLDAGASGGSGGGGGGRDNVGSAGSGGGAGTTGQGNSGGMGGYNSSYPGGGGGGAGTAGVSCNVGTGGGGNGGDGLTFSISGAPVTYGGGGGGGGYTGATPSGPPGNGGAGGGGKGGGQGSLVAVAGAPNTGGGGGGGGYSTGPLAGAAGGSGIVIVRYPVSTLVTSGVFVGTNGNVGIGTTNPTQALQVIGNICATGTVGTCSDARYKQDVTPLVNSLSNLQKLNGVNYYWCANEFPEKKFTDEKQIGFIAQELEKIYPEVVLTDKDGFKTVDYSRLTPILVEAIKEQQKLIEQLSAQNNNLKGDNTEMKAAISSLQSEMEIIKSFIFQKTQK